MRMMFDLYSYLLCTDFSATLGQPSDPDVQPWPSLYSGSGRINHLAAFRKLATEGKAHFGHYVVPVVTDELGVSPEDEALRQAAEQALTLAHSRSQPGPKDKALYRFQTQPAADSDEGSRNRLFNLIW